MLAPVVTVKVIFPSKSFPTYLAIYRVWHSPMPPSPCDMSSLEMPAHVPLFTGSVWTHMTSERLFVPFPMFSGYYQSAASTPKTGINSPETILVLKPPVIAVFPWTVV